MNFTIPAYPHMQFGTLYCIGRNYHEHISEMNSRPTEEPVVFLKPRSSLLHPHETIRIPPDSKNVHHEAELVLLIGETCRRVPKEEAYRKIAAFAIGIDLTARDLQSHAKNNGLPWTLSKGFDTFAPIGPFVPFDASGASGASGASDASDEDGTGGAGKVDHTGNTINIVNSGSAPHAASHKDRSGTHDLLDLAIHLRVNGETRQHDNTSHMIFPPDELISYLSHRFTLTPGDLIFTGTPKGVSQIQPGDVIEASIGGHLSVLTLEVQSAEPL